MNKTPNTLPIASFGEVVKLIETARQKSLQAVNTTLIDLYWQIGETISRKIKNSEWGDGVVDQLADYIAKTQPGLRGFTRSNLFRMRRFYETYQGDEKVAALPRQLSWTHNLIIMGQSKRSEEREFYLRLAIQEKRCALNKIQTGSNSIFTFFPSAAAALTKVVRVKLVSSSSNNLLSDALLVCIFFAIAVLLSLSEDMPSAICQAMTRLVATAVTSSRIASSLRKSSKLLPI